MIDRPLVTISYRSISKVVNPRDATHLKNQGQIGNTVGLLAAYFWGA